MQFAIKNNTKVEATPKQKANCPLCNEEVISKCGELKIWHWAHKKSIQCDTWYERETEWHRNWKKIFGEKYSEVIISKDGKKHIADVCNSNSIIIEFQNSSISTETIHAREEFYGEKMIWVVNALPFCFNFYVEMKAPSFVPKLPSILPSNLFYSSYKWTKPGWFLDLKGYTPNQSLVSMINDYYGFIYINEISLYYLKEPKHYIFLASFILQLENFNRLIETTFKHPNIRRFHWAYPRTSWQTAQRPVFIDFEKGNLLYVKEGMGTNSGFGLLISKETFIKKYNV
jgi:hypothetical protein